MNLQHHILKGIKALLYTHDYLVLPDFGGFVLKSKPSHFSNSGSALLPPSKTVSFNVQLKQNDGLLVLWLQDSLKCSASEAILHLKDFSNYCSGILTAKRRLNMEGLGFFFIDFENNICFEPQADINFLGSSFGLGALSLQPIEPEVSELKKEAVFIDRKITRVETNSEIPARTKRFKHVLTPLIVATLSLSLLLLTVSNLQTKGILYSSMFSAKSGATYSPIAYPDLKIASPSNRTSGYVADANGVANIKISENKTIAVLVLENKLNSVNGNGSTLKLNQKKFEIVLGCFTILSNAKRMHKDLRTKKLAATISEKNSKGMYVVSDGSFDSKEDALQRLDELKANYPKAWIKSSEE